MNTATQTVPLTRINQILGRADVQYLDRARAHPFLKWAGGKRSLISEIVKHLPPSIGAYWEPFLGGGAVFFSLDSRISEASLSDMNLELILTYKMIQKEPEKVIEALKEHAENHGKRYYKKIRDKQHDEQDPVLLAARFIYLNRTCYNGLYRVNKSGRFNVPMGSYKNPTICDEENLRAVSEVLQGVSLKAQSFDQIEPESGDLVYCDPPYDGTFSSYTGNGFTDDDQKALRDACVRWENSGAHVIVSNSDTPLIRSLFEGWKFHSIQAQRNINCKGNERGKESELLVTAEET